MNVLQYKSEICLACLNFCFKKNHQNVSTSIEVEVFQPTKKKNSDCIKFVCATFKKLFFDNFSGCIGLLSHIYTLWPTQPFIV